MTRHSTKKQMASETKQCQNCKQNFVIEPGDFDFYKKIDVPPPTWCPECRQMRRYSWRNERIFYRRPCDLCGKSTVTIYSSNKPYKVFCPPCWWSDNWSALDYGQDFDFSRPFFKQFKELQLKVPRIALLTKNSVNSEYTNHSNNNKNCYWCVSTFDSENVFYGHNVWKNAKDCLDCTFIPEGGELLYECIDSERCHRCQYGILLRDCTDCFYCYDCRNCSNCFLSWNLRNQHYCFLNQKCTKEEYERKISDFKLGSYTMRQGLYQQFLDVMQERALHRFAVIERSTNVTGNMIFNSKNTHDTYDADATEESRFVIVAPNVKDAMDSYHFGFNCELIYECHALIHDYDTMFTHLSYDNSHLQYCDSCHNSENLFGCVGMKQGHYAILNKQYGEAEYAVLRDKIIAHMRKTGEYGEFFPPQLSPFGYNETTGIVYRPFTKKQALRGGWNWEDKVPGTYNKETLKLEVMPDSIDSVTDSVLREALVCRNCRKNFNVVGFELEFYKREQIPLPRECPNCRHMRRVNLRLPRKLWHRNCSCKNTNHFHKAQSCLNEFETSYAPDRKEIVYCEQCYNAEVV